MLLDPGHHLGDAWFAVDGSATVHAFVLRGPDTAPRHTDWHLAHATSTDLVTWSRPERVVGRGAPGAWDDACPATGSVIDDHGSYLLAHTVGWDRSRPAIALSRSEDLVHWRPVGDGPISGPAPGYVVDRPFGPRPVTHWRDPFLRRDRAGRLQILLCAARADRPADRSGTVAVVAEVAPGRWEAGEPLAVQPVARELECPQVREVDGAWFLVFSTWPELFAADVRRVHGERLRPGTYAMVGAGPDGPFELIHPEPIVAADHPQQPYAGQLVRHSGRWLLLGTLWREGEPDALSDPIEVGRVGDRLVQVPTSERAM